VSDDFYVYLHRTADTDRVFYVGKGRARRAHTRSGRSALWKRIADKHGFVVEFVAQGLTEQAAFALETATIAARKGLCNFTAGGEGISGYRHTDETRERIRIAHSGRAQPRELVERRAKLLTGKKRAPGFGAVVAARNAARVCTEATRAKMSASHTGLARAAGATEQTAAWHRGCKRGPEAVANMAAASTTRKGVRCIDRGLEFDSLTTAAAWMRASTHPKANKSGIGAAASGRTATAYGHRWEYA
jgi:hypothetical protein